MADLWNSPEFDPSATTSVTTTATTTVQASPKPKEVVCKTAIKYYHDLGLGRGVNVTDPDMWRNKTPYLVREACDNLENIIDTQECGVLESYQKEVPSFEMLQQKLWVPVASQVRIGMDEQSSRSYSSTKLIEGQKIDTRTISFRFHFDDVPLYDDIDQAVIEAPDTFLYGSDSNEFEEHLANWFLKRINDRETKAPEIDTEQASSEADSEVEEKSVIQRLADKLKNQEYSVRYIPSDCKALLNHLGITHYVSAIKLGACEYRVATSKSEQKHFGVSTSMVAGSLAKGGLLGLLEKQLTFWGKEKKKIGRLDLVKEEVTKEGVVGFEIQPIYKLVRIQFIQMALRKAIKEYIRSKDNKGPYLISSEVQKKPVFWMIEESDHCCQLKATESAAEASLFYIIPVGNPIYPSDFHIAHWGERGRQYTTHVDDLYRTYNVRGPPLPRYVSTGSDRFGRNKGSLSLKNSIQIKNACFSLHSRVQSSFVWMICTSIPVDLSSWLDGEQFYIKCNYHSILKVDSYLAVERAEGDRYKVTTVVSAAGKDSTGIGMLFRLHPKVIKTNAENEQTEVTSEDVVEPTEAPPVDVVEHSSPPEPDAVVQSSPEPRPDTAEQRTSAVPPSVRVVLSQRLLVPAVLIGTAGVLLYALFRALS